MRAAALLLLASASLSSGCSLMIAGSGKDLGNLTTKEQVHAQFGEPSATRVEGGKVVEDFQTRQKLSTWDQDQAEGYAILMVMTLGASELVLTPCELYLLAVRTVLGQTVRAAYDAKGKVAGLYLDGKPIPGTLASTLANPAPAVDDAMPQAPLSPQPASPTR